MVLLNEEAAKARLSEEYKEHFRDTQKRRQNLLQMSLFLQIPSVIKMSKDKLK